MRRSTILILIGLMFATGSAMGEPAQISWKKMTCRGAQLVECERLGEVLQAKKRAREAMILYARACRHGSGASCSRVGWHFMQDGNQSDAMVTFQQACSLEHGPSCFYIGTLVGNGESAMLAYNRACDLGVELACDRVGRQPENVIVAAHAAAEPGICTNTDLMACYHKGRKELAAGRFKQAAADLYPVCHKGGKVESCHFLAAAYTKLENEDQARAAWFKGCQGDIAASCHMLGEAEQGRDPAASEAYFRKACEGGSAVSCYELARGYNDAAIPEQTIGYLKRGCDLGHSASCFSLRAAERQESGVNSGDVRGH